MDEMSMNATSNNSGEHTAHDHSAHASTASPSGMDMGQMDHGPSVFQNPDGSYYYTHGAFLGHIVPGTMFVILGLWWMFSLYSEFLRCTLRRRPFASRTWYYLPVGSKAVRRLPLEPLLKMLLPFLGILGELWLGHPSWRNLKEPDGKFVVDNINDWQHSAMYLAFITSGTIDLLSTMTKLPYGTDRAFIGLAFLVQGILLVFHLKGPSVEIILHLILVLIIFSTVIAIIAEGCAPRSLLIGSIRPYAVLLQGVWWIHLAHMMYRSNQAWNPFYMGSAMMAPAAFVLDMLWVAVFSVLVLICMRILFVKLTGQEISFEGNYPPAAPGSMADAARATKGAFALDENDMGMTLEMSSLIHSTTNSNHGKSRV